MRHPSLLVPAVLALALAACKGAAPALTPADSAGPAVGAPAAAPRLDRAQLEQRAFTALRKQHPDFERLGYSHQVGDIDQDGQDDVAVVYGQGTADASMAATYRLAVLMSRGVAAVPLADADMPEFCPALDKIEAGKLHLRALDICSAARPKTTDFYLYGWDGKTIAQLEHQTQEQRVMAALGSLAKALRARDRATVLDTLRFPLQASAWPLFETPLEAAAQAAGGKIDRALAERHYADLFPDERADLYATAIERLQGQPLKPDANGALSAGAQGQGGESYTVSIQFDPDEDREDGNDRIIDARVDVAAAQGDGGQNLVLLSSQGRLQIAAVNTGG